MQRRTRILPTLLLASHYIAPSRSSECAQLPLASECISSAICDWTCGSVRDPQFLVSASAECASTPACIEVSGDECADGLEGANHSHTSCHPGFDCLRCGRRTMGCPSQNASFIDDGSCSITDVVSPAPYLLNTALGTAYAFSEIRVEGMVSQTSGAYDVRCFQLQSSYVFVCANRMMRVANAFTSMAIATGWSMPSNNATKSDDGVGVDHRVSVWNASYNLGAACTYADAVAHFDVYNLRQSPSMDFWNDVFLTYMDSFCSNPYPPNSENVLTCWKKLARLVVRANHRGTSFSSMNQQIQETLPGDPSPVFVAGSLDRLSQQFLTLPPPCA